MTLRDYLIVRCEELIGRYGDGATLVITEADCTAAKLWSVAGNLRDAEVRVLDVPARDALRRLRVA